MFNVSEQFQESFKPATELMTANLTTMEKLFTQQNNLLTALVSDTVAVTKEVVAQQDLATVLKLQQQYVEGVTEKVSESVKESYALITEAGQQQSDALKATVA